MKLALIGDIHANLPALEAVLAHAREQGVGAIWNVGDFVGYGPFPDEVVQRLQLEYVLSTSGKFDRKVLRFKKRERKWREKKPLEEYVALKWAYEQLSKASRRYLRFLSREIRMKARGRRILLTHTSPAQVKGILQHDTPERHLRHVARLARADVIVSGFTHRPFVRQVGGVHFVNPGSVGWPYDGDRQASYATLVLEDEVQVEHHRVAYDAEPLIAALRAHNLPQAFIDSLAGAQVLKADST
jgi:putative phosphoesterase